MSKIILKITGEVARNAACRHIKAAPEGHIFTIAEPTRTLEANAKMWAVLSEIAAQTDWHGIKLSAEEFKDLLSAGLVKSRVVPNIDGSGFVVLGQRTSKMSKREMGELLELIIAFGVDRGVKFSDVIQGDHGYP